MRTKFCGVYGEITSLPGCAQVGVSHGVYIPVDKRGNGAGTEANRRRVTSMKVDYGYDYALCTADLNNTAQVAVLTKTGWKQLDTFLSSNTGHTVGLFGRKLDDV